MPKNVVELAQGNTFTRSSDANQLVDSATRSWRVILNNANESWDVSATVGVSVGDYYAESLQIPCVSIDAKADGDSRLVRIVTATYRATPGTSASVDPKSQEPTVRPAVYSMTTSLSEIATWVGKKNNSSTWQAMTNPNGDMYDAVTRLEPVVNIAIEQYSQADGTSLLGYVGYVNSESMSFSAMQIGAHCCMLQNISSTPVVERFGASLFRGFKVTYTFCVRGHWTFTRSGVAAIGWDHAVPQTGFNCKNVAPNTPGIEPTALQLKHDESYVVKTPYELAVPTNTIHRAMTDISGVNSGVRLVAASQPIALNDDGSPRSRAADPPVLINRWCVQPEMPFGNNFSAFGINYSQ